MIKKEKNLVDLLSDPQTSLEALTGTTSISKKGIGSTPTT